MGAREKDRERADAPPETLIKAAEAHLRRLGLAAPDQRPAWRLLAGGISNWVVLFACADGVVVKAALPRLRVREEWAADPRRAVLEGHAMAALGARLESGDLPRVLFVDESQHLLGMTYAGADADPWKVSLLAGAVDTRVASAVGALLGRMHRVAWADATLEREFDDLTLFRQLRLDPYHERAAIEAEQRGDAVLAGHLRAGASAMTRDRVTLVHGDFSPKNLLVHRDRVMALDFEVVHWGNPDFDTAFLLTHLALKAIYRPATAPAYRQAAHDFLHAYNEALARRSFDDVVRGAVRQAGCLLVARADGKSRAEYLDDAGRVRARDLGRGVLNRAAVHVDDLFTPEES